MTQRVTNEFQQTDRQGSAGKSLTCDLTTVRFQATTVAPDIAAPGRNEVERAKENYENTDQTWPMETLERIGREGSCWVHEVVMLISARLNTRDQRLWAASLEPVVSVGALEMAYIAMGPSAVV